MTDPTAYPLTWPITFPRRKAWYDLLGVAHDADNPTIVAAFRAKAKLAHPDAGGSQDQMTELNRAYQEALAK